MDNQAIAIVKFLIKETPIGHLRSTIDNLKAIIGIDITTIKEIQDEMINYDDEHLRQVNLGEDRVLVSNLIKDKEGYYVNQNKKMRIAVSPLNDNIDKIEDIEVEECLLRQHLLTSLSSFVEKNYKSAVTATNSKFTI